MMNALKAIFCYMLLTAVAGCIGVEPTDDADVKSDVALAQQNLGGATDCEPTGAIPDDGSDDRAAFQNALDTKHCAIPSAPGVYDISVNLVGVPKVSLRLTGGMRLSGHGPATVLHFYGDTLHGDYRAIQMEGSDNQVTDLMIDTSGLTNTEEQTHGVHVVGPADGSTITGNTFYHPHRADQAGGDCIRLAGTEIAGTPVTVLPARGTYIGGNHFRECDRSGIGIQRGTEGLSVVGNTFYDTGDQDIDAEMTSTGRGYVWEFVGNTFLTLGTPNSAFAVSLSAAGITGTEASSVIFSGNSLLGRGLHAYNLRNAAFTGNSIVRTSKSPATNDAVVHLIKSTNRVAFTGNQVRRDSTASAGAVMLVQLHNSGVPGPIVISGNEFFQETAYHGLYLNGVSRANVNGNSFEMSDPSMYAVNVSSTTTAQTQQVGIVGNQFAGTANAAVMLNGSYLGLGNAVLGGNISVGPTYGIRCNPGTFGTIVSSGNNWPAPLACPTLSSGN